MCSARWVRSRSYFNPLPPKRPPVVEAARRVRMYTGPIGITQADRSERRSADGAHQDGAARAWCGTGCGRSGRATACGRRRWRGLISCPRPGLSAAPGCWRIRWRRAWAGRRKRGRDRRDGCGRGGGAIGRGVAVGPAEATPDRVEDLDLFLRLYPKSRFAPPAAQRRAELSARRSPGRAAGCASVAPSPAGRAAGPVSPPVSPPPAAVHRRCRAAGRIRAPVSPPAATPADARWPGCKSPPPRGLAPMDQAARRRSATARPAR